MAGMPLGRMLKVRTLETALRTGETFECAAARARVSASTAKTWAAWLGIRKGDLLAETPEARLERHGAWALALAGLNRLDEAAAWEDEARKLETALARIGKRADMTAAPEPGEVAAIALLERVESTLPDGAGPMAAWCAVHDYFSLLMEAGACLAPDGRASWPCGVPADLPLTPDWLPCDPWSVEDEAAWESAVGQAIQWL
ncbi:hypothetical protein [Henriciella mobilis]|uniref:hypothetical protein n=1 Tax=Henriciella mobilis TaxID=2305467 RepID=UPI0011C381A5|nr:hypothetical protein [Henriciella mobilis]